MDREALQREARRLLPDADVVRVDEQMRGTAPFKLVASYGSKWEWQQFAPTELMLACKIIAGKLKIGVKP